MVLLPKIKLKCLPTFPGTIYGGTGIEVTKTNGALTVDLDYSDFGEISSIPTSPTSYILTYDTVTNAYVMVPSHLLGGGVSGLADAPVDGNIYGRQSAAWQIVSAAVEYPNKAAVQTATIAVGVGYLRIAGYAAPGDGGAALYTRAGSVPAHAGKIQSADGAWWALAERVLHASMFGVVADGTTDNATNLQNAFTTLAILGGVLVLPRGIIKSTSPMTTNIPAGKGIRVVGQGIEGTNLYFSASAGLMFNYGDPYSSVTAADFTISTDAIGGVDAISVAHAGPIPNPANTAISLFSNITCRGFDGYDKVNYWRNCFEVNNVSNINWLNCMMTSASGGHGTGINLSGLPASSTYGVAYNISNCCFSGMDIGLIYGSYIQGVTISQCNFTGGITGIYCTGSGALEQLSVLGCQFGGLVNCINFSVVLGEFYAIGNLFFVSNNGNGIVGAPVSFSITGNSFQGGAPSSNTGIDLSTGSGIGMITGNCFTGLTTGLYLVPAVQTNVQSNIYSTVTTPTIPASTTGSITIGGGSK